jgi:hypothetical protein
MPQVFRVIWLLLGASVFICRGCDGTDVFNTPYNGGSWIHPPKGGLLHQTSYLGR